LRLAKSRAARLVRFVDGLRPHPTEEAEATSPTRIATADATFKQLEKAFGSVPAWTIPIIYLELNRRLGWTTIEGRWVTKS